MLATTFNFSYALGIALVFYFLRANLLKALKVLAAPNAKLKGIQN